MTSDLKVKIVWTPGINSFIIPKVLKDFDNFLNLSARISIAVKDFSLEISSKFESSVIQPK